MEHDGLSPGRWRIRTSDNKYWKVTTASGIQNIGNGTYVFTYIHFLQYASQDTFILVLMPTCFSQLALLPHCSPPSIELIILTTLQVCDMYSCLRNERLDIVVLNTECIAYVIPISTFFVNWYYNCITILAVQINMSKKNSKLSVLHKCFNPLETGNCCHDVDTIICLFLID